jgi:hypothetical protein
VRVSSRIKSTSLDGSKGHVFEISIGELYIILTYAVLRILLVLDGNNSHTGDKGSGPVLVF